MYYFEQASLESMWKCSVKESRIIAKSVLLYYFEQVMLESIWKCTVKKRQIIAKSVNNCKDCDYALISASDFRKHLEMHGGEK